MRVITGLARNARLKAPEGLSTRPTSDMAKEAIFSILQFELE
jgi:16S rRNA (guanine966-N2)-methyltransferase